MVHFTVTCLVAKPLNRSEAKGYLINIQTLLLFKVKLPCYCVNPLNPNISNHILHTVLCTFTKMLTRRICQTINSFHSLMTLMCDSVVIL